MINLKLVKTKLITDRFCTHKDVHRDKDVHRERKSEKLDGARCLTKPLVSDQDLAVTLKIRGFVFECSDSHVIGEIETGTPSDELSAASSFLDVVYQDSFTMWLQAKALSDSDSTHNKLALHRLIDSYLVSDSQQEDDTSNMISLDTQAEQLALDVLQGEGTSLCRDPSRSDAEIERFLGVTSSAVFQSLNPGATLNCQSVRQDSLFEIIMQTLVEKELQEFYPVKVEQLSPETELQALDPDRVQQLDLETDKTEILVHEEDSRDSWLTGLEEDDHPSPCLMLFASDSMSAPSPEIVVRLGNLNLDSTFDEPTRKVESPKKPSVPASEELRKLQQELKRATAEISLLKSENSHLKDEGARLRKVAMTETVSSTPSSIPAPTSTGSVRSFPPVVYLVAAIILGFIIGKFIL